MHRPNKRMRTSMPFVEVKDRGTDMDVTEEWAYRASSSSTGQRERFLNRPRNRSAEWMDEYTYTPQRIYKSVRVGRPLVPMTLSEDVRGLISEYGTRPSLDAGLFPEQRRKFRDLGEARIPSPNRGVVPCPVCNRFYPYKDLVNWVGDTTEAESWREYMLPPGVQLWPHQRTNPRGIFACSQRCLDEVTNSNQAKWNRKYMREGSHATFPGTDLHDLSYDDYYQTPRLLDEDLELLPTRSYRKRRAESTRDIGV